MTKEEITHTFAVNIERERIRLNLTQSEMARELDMSLSAYKNIITEVTSNVSLYTLHLVHKLTGKYAFELLGYCVPEAEMLSHFRQLNQHQKTYLCMVAEVERSLSAAGSNELTVLVPTTNMEDGMIWDACTYESVQINGHYPLADCAVKVTSNHLHPAYIQGDIILVQRRPPREGDVGIFIQVSTGRAFLRKFHQGNPCLLEPINGYGKTFKVYPDNPESMADWIKFGCVISRLR